MDDVGETLVLSLRQMSCPRALTRVKVKVNVKAKVNRSITPGVAKIGHGQDRASPEGGIAKMRRRQ